MSERMVLTCVKLQNGIAGYGVDEHEATKDAQAQELARLRYEAPELHAQVVGDETSAAFTSRMGAGY